MYTDPIADMLTRIRNAGVAKHRAVEIPGSRVKVEIARVLAEQGYITSYELTDGLGVGTLVVRLKYHREKHVITKIERFSKPGQRRYVKSTEIPTVKNGLGIAIMTTSKGVMTGTQAADAGVGGEIICTVY